MNEINEDKKELKEIKTKKSWGYSSVLVCVFFLSLTTLLIDYYIYILNDKVITINDEINVLDKVNDDLNLQISKLTNLETVIERAKNDSKMLFPTSKDYIRVDMSKEYFPQLKNVDN